MCVASRLNPYLFQIHQHLPVSSSTDLDKAWTDNYITSNNVWFVRTWAAGWRIIRLALDLRPTDGFGDTVHGDALPHSTNWGVDYALNPEILRIFSTNMLCPTGEAEVLGQYVQNLHTILSLDDVSPDLTAIGVTILTILPAKVADPILYDIVHDPMNNGRGVDARILELKYRVFIVWLVLSLQPYLFV